MRNLAVRILLLLCLAASLAGQTGEWKTYKNTDGNFSVLFPGEPKDTVNPGEPGIQSHTLLASLNPAVYTVVYTSMAKEQPVDDATFTIFKDAVFKELPNCSIVKDGMVVVTEGLVSPVLQGYIGHWYRLGCDMKTTKLTIVGNLYWGKHYAYAVMAMFPPASEPATVNKFIGSFSVIDARK